MQTQRSKSPSRVEKSLYDRLGGIYAIATVIDRFSNSLIDNPVVGQNSQNEFLKDWHRNELERLPGLKWMRTLWVCDLAGGPYKFVPTVAGKCPFSLENAHFEFEISPEEFDAVAKELSNALDYYNIPRKEKNEVLAVFSAHKFEVNEGYFVENNLQTKHILCQFK